MTEAPTLPWSAVADGLRVRVRLTPRGGRDAIDGRALLSDGTSVVLARVRAVPEDGRANAALTKLVAAALGVAGSDVAVVAGATSRVKTLAVRGDPGDLASTLAAVTAA